MAGVGEMKVGNPLEVQSYLSAVIDDKVRMDGRCTESSRLQSYCCILKCVSSSFVIVKLLSMTIRRSASKISFLIRI